MATSAASMQARFPEAFANTSTVVLDAAIAEASRHIDATNFGADYNDAVLYFAADLVVSGKLGAKHGIKSASVDGVSTTFGAGNEASSFRAMYERLARRASLGFTTSSFGAWGF